MRIYLDSSALIKRYIHEAGSERVFNLCASADQLVLSALCMPETIAAFRRLWREKKMTEDIYRLLKKDFNEDIQEALVVGLESEIIMASMDCVEKQPVGTLDAIHLATALSQECDLFLSADAQQQKAARALGLKVEAI